ncbi:MAG: SLC13 family permease [Rhodothermaceae bacterium]|nr:SLC13 family permease [Rhodothermaceae bacterium]
MDLGWQAYVTLGALVLMVVALVRSVARTDLVLMGTLGLLLLAGIVTPEAAFAGFANPAVIAIATLFIVAAGVERTGALGFLDGLLRPRSGRIGRSLLRLMLPTSFLSGVLNNTPIVAMLIPRVQAWGRSSGIDASKLLMPLSTAAIVGGWLTLIGTSTNVIVHGLLLAEGLPGFSFFELTWVGIPAALVVSLYYALGGHRLLPSHDGAALGTQARAYQFEARVAPGSPLIGQTVEAAGLRTLGDVYLAHVRRGDLVKEVQPETTLFPEDVLTFVGDVGTHDAVLRRRGLERAAPMVNDARNPDLPLFEVVVAPGSRLVGHTLQDVGFRERYGGVVLAIQRRDEPIEGGLGRVPLRAGDLLLIEGRPALAGRLAARSDDFALVAPLGYVGTVSSRAPVALAILVGMVGLVATNVLPLATATFAAALGMIVTGCLRGSALRGAVDVPVILVIAAALGIGSAVETTGLASVAAEGLLMASGALGPIAMLVLVYIAANILAELITNKASAVLMLPVALAVAADLGASWKAFAVVVTIGSAASFLTPIGYQTNLMVMGVGGYRYTDYAKAGAPVSLLVMAVTVTVCALVWL